MTAKNAETAVEALMELGWLSVEGTYWQGRVHRFTKEELALAALLCEYGVVQLKGATFGIRLEA